MLEQRQRVLHAQRLRDGFERVHVDAFQGLGMQQTVRDGIAQTRPFGEAVRVRPALVMGAFGDVVANHVHKVQSNASVDNLLVASYPSSREQEPKMARKEQLVYAIRYSFNGEYGNAIGSGVRGRGFGADRQRFRVEARTGHRDEPQKWVHVHTEEAAVADGVFCLLAREYAVVEIADRDDGWEARRAIHNLDPQDIPARFSASKICDCPSQLVLGVALSEQREASLEAMRKAMLKSNRPRTTRKGNDMGPMQPGLRSRILERDNFKCRRCGATPGRRLRSKWTTSRRDAKGGTNDVRNLQTLCWACNRGKGATDPHPSEVGQGAA
jgi:5-methylcytosine-specific restriction endonuclease McrA